MYLCIRRIFMYTCIGAYVRENIYQNICPLYFGYTVAFCQNEQAQCERGPNILSNRSVDGMLKPRECSELNRRQLWQNRCNLIHYSLT